jgi:hypothetical protein
MHAMLAELLHYCESEKVRWIKRYELGKKCNMSGGNFNRALEWAENESFIKFQILEGNQVHGFRLILSQQNANYIGWQKEM